MDTSTPRSTLAVSKVLWLALSLALSHFVLVLLTQGDAPSQALLYVRAIVSCLVLPVAGLPFALVSVVCSRRGQAERAGPVGAFTLLALSMAFALLVFFGLALLLRGIKPPITGHQLSLAVLGISSVGLLIASRFEELSVAPERGLSGRVLIAGVVVAVAFGAIQHVHLFGGLTRFLVLSPTHLRLLGEERIHDPREFRIRFVAGTERGDDIRRAVTARTATLVASSKRDAEIKTRLSLVYTAAPGSAAELWSVPRRRCGLAGTSGEAAAVKITGAAVPLEILGIKVRPATRRFNALIIAKVRLLPGDNCFELRFQPPPDGPAGLREVIDITGQDLEERDLFGGRLTFVNEGTGECHVNDELFRQVMRRSNEFPSHAQVFGYFTQMITQVLSGSRDPMLGVLFLFLALCNLAAALVLIGAATATGGPPRRSLLIAGLLALGPFLGHLQGLVFSESRSYAFPDSPYSFMLLGAVTLLVLKNRLGFILLGCFAALSRNPGAYVLAVALFARLIIFADDRRWTWRTLLWSLGSGVGLGLVLMIYWSQTCGLESVWAILYSETFPEHFDVTKNAAPAYIRAAAFFVKLSLLSALTTLLMPFIRNKTGKLLTAITLGYVAVLMTVHVPHDHYFPVMIYAGAAAGLGAVARRPAGALTWFAIAAVCVGTVLSFHAHWVVVWLTTP